MSSNPNSLACWDPCQPYNFATMWARLLNLEARVCLLEACKEAHELRIETLEARDQNTKTIDFVQVYQSSVVPAADANEATLPIPAAVKATLPNMPPPVFSVQQVDGNDALEVGPNDYYFDAPIDNVVLRLGGSISVADGQTVYAQWLVSDSCDVLIPPP